jgi:hypothetical protein
MPIGKQKPAAALMGAVRLGKTVWQSSSNGLD